MPEGDGGTSYDGAIDDFLAESGGEEATPEVEEVEEKAPKKEQPKEKQPAKPAPKAKTGDKGLAKAEDDPDPEDEDGETAKPKDGPWRAELAKRGIDSPEVNQYMSEVVQPYITRLEQQGGPIAALFEGSEEAAGVAAGILDGLDSDPAKTIAELITLLDVDDNAINAALEAAGIDTGGEQQPPQGQQPEEEAELTPEQQWIRERMQQEEQESDAQAYESFIKQVGQEFGPDFDENLFSLAMASTDDIEQAMELYPHLHEQYGQKPAKAAPPVMGRKSPGQSPQPAQKSYDGSNQGWESAFDDLFAEENARRR